MPISMNIIQTIKSKNSTGIFKLSISFCFCFLSPDHSDIIVWTLWADNNECWDQTMQVDWRIKKLLLTDWYFPCTVGQLGGHLAMSVCPFTMSWARLLAGVISPHTTLGFPTPHPTPHCGKFGGSAWILRQNAELFKDNTIQYFQIFPFEYPW